VPSRLTELQKYFYFYFTAFPVHLYPEAVTAKLLINKSTKETEI